MSPFGVKTLPRVGSINKRDTYKRNRLGRFARVESRGPKLAQPEPLQLQPRTLQDNIRERRTAQQAIAGEYVETTLWPGYGYKTRDEAALRRKGGARRETEYSSDGSSRWEEYYWIPPLDRKSVGPVPHELRQDTRENQRLIDGHWEFVASSDGKQKMDIQANSTGSNFRRKGSSVDAYLKEQGIERPTNSQTIAKNSPFKKRQYADVHEAARNFVWL